MFNTTTTLFEVTFDQEPKGIYATHKQAEAHAALVKGATIVERTLTINRLRAAQ